MTSEADGRAKLIILGGFLGSGKSTWLRHQLHERALEDVYVIVNEVAEIAVDQVMLHGSAKLATLAGGCACCSGLGRLIALLREIADQRVSGMRFDRIVVETSGLADPAPIVGAIRNDPVLVHHILVSEVVVTVDALHGLMQLASEPLGRAQAQLADRLVITKVDAAELSQLQRTLATLRVLNPTAEISGSDHGSLVPLPDFSGAEPMALPLPDGAEAKPIAAVKLIIGAEIDWTAFTVWLSALLHARGNDVLRVKGVVRTPAGRLLLQSVRHTVQSPEILPEDGGHEAGEDDAVVVIGRGFSQAALQHSLRYFAGPA